MTIELTRKEFLAIEELDAQLLSITDIFFRELQEALEERGITEIENTHTGEVIDTEELARVRGIISGLANMAYPIWGSR